MATVRELLEEGTKEGLRLAKKMLTERYGDVPLCCFETQFRTNSLGHKSTWMKCDWLKRWYTANSFKRKCIECQNQILRILQEKGYA